MQSEGKTTQKQLKLLGFIWQVQLFARLPKAKKETATVLSSIKEIWAKVFRSRNKPQQSEQTRQNKLKAKTAGQWRISQPSDRTNWS